MQLQSQELQVLNFVGLDTRKTVFCVCHQVRLKSACPATETSYNIENFACIKWSLYFLESRKRITKALSDLTAQAVLWLCRIQQSQVFSPHGHIIFHILYKRASIALARLHRCAGLFRSPLLSDVISIKISCADPYYLFIFQ